MASTTTGRPTPFPPRRRPAEEKPEAGETTVEPYRLTPKLARRVALLSALVVIGFAALFMRLWALQVLAGSQYAARARANQVRTVRVQAPRGTIVDQHGNVLVANEPVTSVELSPSGMPKVYATRVAELRALAHVTGVSVRHLTNLIVARRKVGDTLDPIVVRTRATGPMLTYLEERSAEFPGLTLARTYIRRYPHGSLAAQLLGYDGQISASELKALGKDGYAPGDVIGQTGAEFAFNPYLRGTPGLARVHVDSLGRPRSPRLLTTPPQQGQTVRLTLDTGLQVAAQNALQDGIQAARNSGQFAADGGAIVALNPQNGSILALASAPSYNPSVWSGPRTTKALNAQGLGTPQSALDKNYPALNRALDATYPPGSAFKPLTAIAALEEHMIKPYSFYPCTGTYTAPEDRSHHVFHNWDPNVNEGMDLPTALAQSCDTYFYGVGNNFYLLPPDRGQPLQRWARKFGFGSKTGIDVGPEVPGTVPTIALEVPHDHAEDRPDQLADRPDLEAGRLDHARDRPGKPARDADPDGAALRGDRERRQARHAARPDGRAEPERDDRAHDRTVGAAADPGSESGLSQGGPAGPVHGHAQPARDVLRRLRQLPVRDRRQDGHRREGRATARHHLRHNESQSWWCGYGPTNDAKLVVCAVIENGGEGGAAAAPAAERVFAKFFRVHSVQTGYTHSD